MRKGIDCKGKEWVEKLRLSPKLKDLSKQKFNRLQPLFVVNGKQGETLWLCWCDCGNTIVVERRNLENGHSSSCGCYQKDKVQKKREENNNELLGVKFGKLTIISYDGCFAKGESKYKHSYHTCMCDCGNKIQVRTTHLTSGVTQSCGCIRNEKFSALHSKNLIDKKFGLLTVVELIGSNEKKIHLWRCKCECGGEKIVNTNDLTTGNVKSCGCIKTSTGEIIIQKLLEENNIPYKKEYTFPDLISSKGGHPRYDFAILKNNLPIRFIEFDGKQHEKSREWFGGEEGFQRLQENDKLKNQYALSHNIPLVRIPYKELNKLNLSLLFNDKYIIKEV